MADWREGGRPASRSHPPTNPPAVKKPANDGGRADWRMDVDDAPSGMVFQDDGEQLSWWATHQFVGFSLLIGAAALVVLFIVIAAMKPVPLSVRLAAQEYWLPDQPYAVGDSKMFGLLAEQNKSATIRLKKMKNWIGKEDLEPEDVDEVAGNVGAEKADRASRRETAAYYLLGRGYVEWDRKNKTLLPRMSFDGGEALDVEAWLKSLTGDVIVILDGSRGRDRWDFGESYNLFPLAVRQTIERLEKTEGGDDAQLSAKLCVITSCSEGERDWIAPPMLGSPVARATQLGLVGSGGVARRSAKQLFLWKTVAAGDLAEYIQRQSRTWSITNSSLEQNPQVFFLKLNPQTIIARAAPKPEFPTSKPDAIDKNFERIKGFVADLPSPAAARAQAPLTWARLENAMAVAAHAATERCDGFETSFQDAERAKEAIRSRLLKGLPQASKTWETFMQELVNGSTHNNGIRATLRLLRSDGLLIPEEAFVDLLIENVDWQEVDNDPEKTNVVRLALQVWDISERLATTTDPRVHWFTQHMQPPGQKEGEINLEELRRRATDRLLANQWDEARQNYIAILADYEHLLKRQARVADTLALIDTMFAEAPWCGLWSLDELHLTSHESVPQNDTAAQAAKRLDEAAEQTEARLQAYKKAYSSVRKAASDLKAIAQSDIAAVDKSELLQLEIQGIHHGQEHARARHEALRQCQNPHWVINNAETNTLAQAIKLVISTVDDAGTESWQPMAIGPPGRKSTEHSQVAYRTRMSKLLDNESHPLQWMIAPRQPLEDADLGEEGREGSFEKAVCDLGVAVRHAIDKAETIVLKLVEDDASADSWQALFAESIELRKLAWLLAKRLESRPEDIPWDRFYRHCWTEQRRWLAERALRDFWGNRPRDDQMAFELLSNYYVSANAQEADWKRLSDQLQKDLKRCRDKAAALSFENVETELDGETILAGSIAGLSAQWPVDGVAALQLEGGTADKRMPVRTVGGTRSERSRRIAWQPPIGSPPTFKLHSPQDEQLPEEGKISLTYRGHRRKQSVRLVPQPIDWLSVVHEPELRTPQITVQGDAGREIEVAFILDCSRSMKNRLTGESKDVRMRVAQDQLNRLVDKMYRFAGERCRVSLWMYGHRSAWPTERSKKYGRSLKPGVRGNWRNEDFWDTSGYTSRERDFKGPPDLDVGLEVDTGMLDKNQVVELENKINSAAPHGGTPLYYAIHRAIENMGPANLPPRTRHIFLMTDGGNWIQSENEFGELKNYRSKKRVQQELSVSNVKLATLFLGRDPTERPDDQKLSEQQEREIRGYNALKELASSDDFFHSNNLQQMQGRIDLWLSDVLGAAGYYVRPISAASTVKSPQEPSPFNSTWEAEDHGHETVSSGEEYDVVVTKLPPGGALASRTVRLHGWEDLQLKFIAGEQSRLAFLPYDKAEFNYFGDPRLLDPEEFSMVSVGENRMPQLVTGLMHGVRRHDEVEFRAALQFNADTLQTPQPAAVWIEVAPSDIDGALLPQRSYRSCDIDCQGRNIPVLKWRVTKWPAESQSALVNHYCVMDESALAALWEPWRIDANGAASQLLECSWSSAWESIDDGRRWRLRVFSRDERAGGVLVRVVRGASNDPVVRTERRQAKDGSQTEHWYEFDERQTDITLELLAAEKLKDVCRGGQPRTAFVEGVRVPVVGE